MVPLFLPKGGKVFDEKQRGGNIKKIKKQKHQFISIYIKKTTFLKGDRVCEHKKEKVVRNLISNITPTGVRE